MDEPTSEQVKEFEKPLRLPGNWRSLTWAELWEVIHNDG